MDRYTLYSKYTKSVKGIERNDWTIILIFLYQKNIKIWLNIIFRIPIQW